MREQTLGEAFPAELTPVREARDCYKKIGPVGAFALGHIEPLIAPAERAWAEQDTVAMIRLYPRLQAVE